MSTLQKRLESVEERIALQQHRELQRQFKGRSLERAGIFLYSWVLAGERH